jgi:hypothetical protein
MSKQLEHTVPAPVAWCGRSWEGLVDRRHQAFQHALALRDVTPRNSRQVVSEFLAFFDETGIGLFRDEEEWIFRELRPTPRAVIDALEGHLEISSLIQALLSEAQAGCVDVRVIHRLGEVLETHLLLEEEEIGPLFRGDPTLMPTSLALDANGA